MSNIIEQDIFQPQLFENHVTAATIDKRIERFFWIATILILTILVVNYFSERKATP